MGLSRRAGFGKARHSETAELWVHDALERQEFELVKLGRESKPAAFLAKPLPRKDLASYLVQGAIAHKGLAPGWGGGRRRDRPLTWLRVLQHLAQSCLDFGSLACHVCKWGLRIAF